MRIPRIGTLVVTAVAWLAPAALAMWLDVQRFVAPDCPPEGGYVAKSEFQALMFMVRFGWALVLVLLGALMAQTLLLQRAQGGSESAEMR
jgi:hypothetical protein